MILAELWKHIPTIFNHQCTISNPNNQNRQRTHMLQDMMTLTFCGEENRDTEAAKRGDQDFGAGTGIGKSRY